MSNDNKKLTDKQKRFCEEYVLDWNATRAAKAAGYSKRSARQQASKMLTKKSIIEYVALIKGESIAKISKKYKTKKDNDVGYIYLIKCNGSSYYKLGKTKNDPNRRLGCFQIGIPFDLKMIHYIRINKHTQVEKYLHWFYKLNRVRGEWFVFSDNQLEQVIEKMNSYE